MRSLGQVLVAARGHDLRSAPFDAFAKRHVDIVEALAEHYEVVVVLFDDGVDVARSISPLVRRRVPSPSVRPHGRVMRLWRAALDGLGQGISAPPGIAEGFEPDVVVTIGPWLHEEFRGFWKLAPSLHFFEEELLRMRELAPQTRRAQALRGVEMMLSSRSTIQPQVLAVISNAEAPFARRRFPRSWIRHVPYFIPQSDEQLQPSSHEGAAVYVPGVLSEQRNAEGLAAVLEECASRRSTVQFVLASATGYHPVLRPFIELDNVTLLPGDTPKSDCYRAARLVLIPSLRATGIKSTLIEAWVAGRPVVTTASSLLAAGACGAAAVGKSPSELLQQLEYLWSNDAARRKLASSGLRASRNHDRATILRQVIAEIERLRTLPS